MAKSKKIKQKKIQVTVKHRLAGVAILATSAFLLVSMILTQQGAGGHDQIGYAGGFLSRVLLGFLGTAGIVVPSIGILLGILFLLGFKEDHIRINLLGFFIVVLALLGLFSAGIIGNMTFLEAMDQGMQGLGGGILGMAIAWLLQSIIGSIGAYIFLAGMTLAGLCMFLEGFQNLFFKRVKANWKNRKQVKKDKRLAKVKKKEIKPVSAKKPNQPQGPLIHGADVDDSSYQSVKGLLMDENIGKKDKKVKNEKISTEKGREEQALEAQLEISLASDKTPKGSAHTWKYPPLSLLKEKKVNNSKQSEKEVQETATRLEETLESFGVSLKVDQVSIGPSITRYEAKLAPGVKVSKILRLSDDIALSLATAHIRIEAPIPGKAAIGIEVPNKTVREVTLHEIVSDEVFQKGEGSLLVALGQDIAGKVVVTDLARMPHLLIAGATGSGKSVCMNALICSLLYKYRPDEMKFLMIDPKKVELSNYNEIPHMIAPVITEPKRAAVALKWMTSEMENRYSLFAQEGVKDIYGYNRRMREKQEDDASEATILPYIVILIDELADLMMVSPADVEDAVCRLAQMARAAGMHLVVATQRPSVNVITGLIKANIPSRISFAVSSQVDSRTILDGAGAEKLLGRGDMLFAPVGLNKPRRVQGANITEKEVNGIVDFLKKQDQPEYLQGIEVLDEVDQDEEDSDMDCDELLWEAGSLVIESGQASISMLQRRLRIGYTRAARIIDQLEDRHIVEGYQGPKARNVLVDEEEFARIVQRAEEGS